jgi:hypothetical protein
MKRIITATLISLAAGFAAAAPHGFQSQIGASELDPSIWEGPTLAARPFASSSFTPSVTSLYRNANVDGIAPSAYQGSIVPSGPTRISLYEVYRGTAEGTGHADYYERFPADLDWAAIARERRERQGNV